jgi:hypothetical protein
VSAVLDRVARITGDYVYMAQEPPICRHVWQYGMRRSADGYLDGYFINTTIYHINIINMLFCNSGGGDRIRTCASRVARPSAFEAAPFNQTPAPFHKSGLHLQSIFPYGSICTTLEHSLRQCPGMRALVRGQTASKACKDDRCETAAGCTAGLEPAPPGSQPGALTVELRALRNRLELAPWADSNLRPAG